MLAAVQASEKHSMPDLFFEGNKCSVLEMLFWKGSDSWSTFQRRYSHKCAQLVGRWSVVGIAVLLKTMQQRFCLTPKSTSAA